MRKHTRRPNVVLARVKRRVIFLNRYIMFISEKEYTVNEADYLHHRIEVGVGYAISKNEASDYSIRVFCIVDVDVTPV
jgi:hypothetical protein